MGKEFYVSYDPLNYPQNMSGKLSAKIIIKDDYIRKDGTCALFIQIFVDGKRKRIPTGVSVSIKSFDKKNQRVKGNTLITKDYNLILSKYLADINKIAINYRLNGQVMTMEKLINDLYNPTAKVDFLKFYDFHLEKQKKLLKEGTYRQQKSTLKKIKKWKKTILFHEVSEDLLNELKVYLKKTCKNEQATISTTLKNFKKYLHIANKEGINTPLNYTDIHIKSFQGNRTFLNEKEISKLYKLWNSDFVKENHKFILDRFLFSCFTGLRISDIFAITQENIVGEFLVFTAKKQGKFQRIMLNKSARKFINSKGSLFNGDYSPEHINRELKDIANICGIKKKISFHVSRHTFATNFLIQGGRIENLQKLLGHSAIKETMIYVHIVDSIVDDQINNLDNIIF